MRRLNAPPGTGCAGYVRRRSPSRMRACGNVPLCCAAVRHVSLVKLFWEFSLPNHWMIHPYFAIQTIRAMPRPATAQPAVRMLAAIVSLLLAEIPE
jgi:hypothetical protein